MNNGRQNLDVGAPGFGTLSPGTSHSGTMDFGTLNLATPSLEQQREYYDVKWAAPPPVLNPTEQKRVAFIRQHLGRLAQSRNRRLRILDFGCGQGLYSAIAFEFGDVDAIDLSPKAIELAKDRFPGPRYQVASVYEYESDQRLDAILSLEVLEHLCEQEKYVRKCAAFLPPGGELLITTPNRRVADKYWAAPGRLETRQPLENWLDPTELKKLLEPWFQILSLMTHDARYSRRGLMRIVNSTRLNKLFRTAGVENPLRLCYEKWGLGVFQFVHARRKSLGASAVAETAGE